MNTQMLLNNLAKRYHELHPDAQIEVKTLAEHYHRDRLKNTRSRRLLQDPDYHDEQRAFALRDALTFQREREESIKREYDKIKDVTS